MLNSLTAGVTGLVAGAHGRQRLAILNYHRVLDAPDPLRPNTPTVEQFQWQMRLLARHLQPLSLTEAVSCLRSGTLPSRAVCVTFDDGYADNALNAAPVLLDCGVPATVFVTTGFLDGGLMWNDAIFEYVRVAPEGPLEFCDDVIDIPPRADDRGRRITAHRMVNLVKHLPFNERQAAVDTLRDGPVALPDDLMMRSAQVVELDRRGIDIGAHTLSHPILASIDAERARQEIGACKPVLESLLGKPVSLFAYPNGKAQRDYRQEHCAMAADAGYEAALSTNWGVASPASDLFQLPRFTPWDRNPTRFLARLLLNYRHPG